jgi:hypothetical protein
MFCYFCVVHNTKKNCSKVLHIYRLHHWLCPYLFLQFLKLKNMALTFFKMKGLLELQSQKHLPQILVWRNYRSQKKLGANTMAVARWRPTKWLVELLVAMRWRASTLSMMVRASLAAYSPSKHVGLADWEALERDVAFGARPCPTASPKQRLQTLLFEKFNRHSYIIYKQIYDS